MVSRKVVFLAAFAGFTLGTLIGVAQARTCDGRGVCRDHEADRIVERERLRCVYGRARIETRPDGSTVVHHPKVCRPATEGR